MWKLNNSLLEDESYCEKIRALIDCFLLFEHAFSSSGSFWESLKTDIKVESIAFSKQKRRDLSDRRVSLTNRLIPLKHRLVSGDPSVKSEIADFEGSLKVLMTDEYMGAKIRSQAKWLEEGEAPTKFFLKLASQKFEKSFVFSVLNSDGVEVSTLPERDLFLSFC